MRRGDVLPPLKTQVGVSQVVGHGSPRCSAWCAGRPPPDQCAQGQPKGRQSRPRATLTRSESCHHETHPLPKVRHAKSRAGRADRRTRRKRLLFPINSVKIVELMLSRPCLIRRSRPTTLKRRRCIRRGECSALDSSHGLDRARNRVESIVKLMCHRIKMNLAIGSLSLNDGYNVSSEPAQREPPRRPDKSV